MYSQPLVSSAPVSIAFRKHGIDSFSQALEWVHALPYGRNSDRANYMLIFQELRGTCSTKHAAVAALAHENGIFMQLQMAICKLDATLEPKVQPLLDQMGIEFLPEAHCYLHYAGQDIDLTFPDQAPTLRVETLEVHTIQPEQIGSYKLAIHQDYLKKWLKLKKLDMTFEEVWQLRENWIQSLSS